MSPKEKIYFLRDELHHHNHLYYVKNEPIISDYEFDLKLSIPDEFISSWGIK